MAFTLLHSADLHLGKSFSDLPPEKAAQRRTDLLTTLIRLCRTARDTRVDLLCLAGDLFDRPTPASPLLAAVRQALTEATVPVLLLPGNHDPLDAHSPYLDTHWPGNVLVASTPGWQRISIADLEVWAFGYTCGEAHRSPWASFPGCGPRALLALHAACLGPGLATDAGYYPFTPADIPPCAYLALGHHHRQVQAAENPVAWYPGTPEPLEPEVVPAGVLRVEIDGSSTLVTPLALAARRHQAVTIDVTGLTADNIWDRALAASTPEDLLTLTLCGVLDASVALDLSALRAELTARCFAVDLRADAMHLPVDGTTGEGVLGTLYTIAHERLATLPADDPQRARVERAVRYAVLALEGRL